MDPDLHDIQGNILHGYRVSFGVHFPLAVESAPAARTLIRSMIEGTADVPRISTAADPAKPEVYHLNIGFTWDGLRALGVPVEILQDFPTAFREGPATRAESLGDIGDSSPPYWRLGNPGETPMHVLLSLYSADKEQLDEQTSVLEGLFRTHGLAPASRWLEAESLPEGAVHFGYRDGIAQPRLRGTAPGTRTHPPSQPECELGEFLLGKDYINPHRPNFLGRIPAQLGDNSTYAALRVMKQDVWEFERFLTRTAANLGISRELLAAKLMGRWRNGIPLPLSPDTSDAPIERAEKNNFDFVPTPEFPDIHDDSQGLRCPVGSHMRRSNPRNHPVAGRAHSRRIIRRGMPYGPAFDHEDFSESVPYDGVERGLIGLFICGDIERQFEFILKAWVNDDRATAGIRGTRDPILGAQPDGGGRFLLPTDSGTRVIDGVPRFIHTRGSVYCFMPGIGGLRYLGTLSAPSPIL
jgi:deferrochelatase/peroxidase EfeB